MAVPVALEGRAPADSSLQCGPHPGGAREGAPPRILSRPAAPAVNCLRVCAPVVPAPCDGESPPVPVEAPVVEPASGAAVRIVLPVHRLCLDEIAACSLAQALVPARVRSREPPAAARPRERGPGDVAGGAAARERDGQVRATVAREVVTDDRVDAGEPLARQILYVRR